MKKYAIFCLFSLILCVSPFILQNKVYAELVGYTINISSQIANDNSGQYVDTDKFNSATNTFTADYSDFIETGSISQKKQQPHLLSLTSGKIPQEIY